MAATVLDIYKQDWDGLTKEQKAAATLLGFNMNSWCTISDDQYNEEADYATAAPTDDESLYYRDYEWEELPEEAKAAAKKFGYTSAKQWNNQIYYDVSWDQLNGELRAAAVFPATHLTKDDYWSELPEDLKAAAISLGYTEEMWDNGRMPVETFEKMWDQLTEEQRLSAMLLFGYTEDTWNVDVDWKDEVAEDDEKKWNNINKNNWNELTPVLQRTAGILGFDQKTWDNVDAPAPPPLTLKNWDELLDVQQEAALSLGWTKQLWCDSTDDGTTVVVDEEEEADIGAATIAAIEKDIIKEEDSDVTTDPVVDEEEETDIGAALKKDIVEEEGSDVNVNNDPVDEEEETDSGAAIKTDSISEEEGDNVTTDPVVDEEETDIGATIKKDIMEEEGSDVTNDPVVEEEETDIGAVIKKDIIEEEDKDGNTDSDDKVIKVP
eukprot:CAMPEP_0170982236 /NCGR_PEP_ID=MMETSP0736-20130129/3498_1 /TAXON_ID=186038 /ORGANISM="Fragilariopsis kerguelensis, Strain L26-C5" /LENGTH=435 /DNA_ID=CAMNT_0011405405 /DNA_START=271 /DNA_END=1582 /DNA_ORIENTATION=-